MQGTQHAESVERQNGGTRLVCSLRRNPALTGRKSENLTYSRLVIFSSETTRFLRSFEANNGLYELAPAADKTGLKLAYIFGNQKLWAIKGSKRCTEEEKPRQ
jgi:hypothetical protein